MSEAPGTDPQPRQPPAASGPPAGTRPARYPRTANGLIGSLIVTVLVILGFVALRSCTSDDLEVKPEPVDYLATVADAQAGGYRLVYPASLPDGWIADSIDFVPGDHPAWGIGMLTDDGKFVGLRQEDAPLDELLHTYVDADATAGDPVDVSGSVAPTWRTYSDAGGDHAFAAEVGRDTVLVYGSASVADQRELLALLSTAKR
ncbi:MAG: hypothetical protein JWO76_2446 [Nocardioides sp.]|nr:hypothetical protein [Nocardioides sp.]